MLAKLFCAFLVLSICGLEVTECNHDEDTWVEPNAWSRDTPGLRLGKDLDNCPVCSEFATNTEEGVALLYYKKLIATLFKREKLQYNADSTVYQYSVFFSILPAQLEKLEKLTNPRDLDSVLTEIIAAARTIDVLKYNEVNKRMGTTALVLDILKDLLQLFKILFETIKDLLHLVKISEVRFMLVVLLAILLGWFVHKRYHVGYITIIIVGILLFGYFVTYLECNRKLEIDEMIQFINNGEPETGWFSSVVSYFKKPNKNEAKIEALKKSNQFKLRFCRPDHVVIMYVNDLFLKQLELLIEKCFTMTSMFSTNLTFPFNWLAPIILFMLVGYILKLTFKYMLSPKAWASLWHSRREHSQQHLSTATSGVASLTEDRLSGENLKILLDAINRPQIVVPGQISPQNTSGVEKVLEQIKTNSKSNFAEVSLAKKPSGVEEVVSLTENQETESIVNSNANKSKEISDNSRDVQNALI